MHIGRRGEVRFVVPDRAYARLAAGSVAVRGLGPFDLTFTPTGIKGRVDGKLRSLACTWPEGVVRPMFRLDGARYLAGWADDHSVSKGTKTPQFALAFAVTDGAHEVTVSEWEFPPLPPVPGRQALRF